MKSISRSKALQDATNERQLPQTGSECRDVLKDILKLIRLGYHGNIRLGQLANVGIDQHEDLRPE